MVDKKQFLESSNENTLLIEALQTLTRSEWLHWLDFVRSPFFNKKEHLILLAEYGFQCFEKKQDFTRKDAFNTTFPALEVFDDGKIRLAASRLLSLLEKFWVVTDAVDMDASIRLQIPRVYRRRGLSRHFSKTLREAKADCNKQLLRNAAHYDNLLMLENELYEENAVGKRTETFNLQEISDLMDASFVAKKLRHACFSLSHQAVFKVDYQTGLLQQVLDFVEKSTELKQLPAIALYFHCYRFLTLSNGEQDFRVFRAILSKEEQSFPEVEIRSLYRLALNFCIKKINASDSTFYQETMILYKAVLDKDFLLENGFLSRFSYNNIVVLALKVNELAWAEQFIHQYKPKVERAHREALFALNLARIEYLRKNYKAALLHLQNADYKDLIHNLSAKTLQMKIFFELEEIDLLEAYLNSMEKFIRRHVGLTYHRDSFTHFIRLTRQILQTPKEDVVARKLLKKNIIEISGLSEKDWLLERLEGVV
jgi:hypothetical protein